MIGMLLNNIICGDNVEVLKTFPADMVDLTVTSPPYDDMREYEGYDFDFEALAKELYRITKPGGVVVWVVADQVMDGDESGTSFKHALGFKNIGFRLFDTIIYDKPSRGAVGNSKGYWQSFEYMFVFSKGEIKTINLIQDRANKHKDDVIHKKKQRLPDGSFRIVRYGKIASMGRRTNVWKYNIGKGGHARESIAFTHPAIFPEKLAADHIKSWSDQKDLVLDPFCGSGTTCKMAKLFNRNYIGIDISEKYCKLSRKRTEQTPLM